MQGSPPEVAATVREGDVIAGKYRVEKILGAGGMGIVVAARHIQLDETVAIKFLLPEMLSNYDAVSRFAREARAAVKIKGEHVARVFDVGALENGAPFMVMEFLEGGDLSGWLEQRGALPVEQAVEFVIQACVAIAEAHALGIVHRDLKPANLFCVRRADGNLSIKVLDFGISKVMNYGIAGAGSATQTSALMGSPYYMSPEQLQSSKDVDSLTDIWALGIVLYELLAGQVPFPGDSIPGVTIKVVSQAPPPLSTFRPELPRGLENAIFKCLEKDRRLRHRNVAELALALLPFGPRRARASVERISGIIQAAGLSQSALALPPSPKAAEETLVSAGGTMAPVGNTVPGLRRGKVATFTGLAVVAVSAVAVLLSPRFRLRAETPQGPAASADRATNQAAAVMPAISSPIPVAAAAASSSPSAGARESISAPVAVPAVTATTTALAKPARRPAASVRAPAPSAPSPLTKATADTASPGAAPTAGRAPTTNPSNALDLPMLH